MCNKPLRFCRNSVLTFVFCLRILTFQKLKLITKVRKNHLEAADCIFRSWTAKQIQFYILLQTLHSIRIIEICKLIDIKKMCNRHLFFGTEIYNCCITSHSQGPKLLPATFYGRNYRKRKACLISWEIALFEQNQMIRDQVDVL